MRPLGKLRMVLASYDTSRPEDYTLLWPVRCAPTYQPQLSFPVEVTCRRKICSFYEKSRLLAMRVHRAERRWETGVRRGSRVEKVTSLLGQPVSFS